MMLYYLWCSSHFPSSELQWLKSAAFLLACSNSCLNVWKFERVSRIVYNVTRLIFPPIFPAGHETKCLAGAIPKCISKPSRDWLNGLKSGHMTIFQNKDLICRITCTIIYAAERYVGWGCILNCFMLPSLPCFYAFCWSAIPTSCYIFNVFYSCNIICWQDEYL